MVTAPSVSCAPLHVHAACLVAQKVCEGTMPLSWILAGAGSLVWRFVFMRGEVGVWCFVCHREEDTTREKKRPRPSQRAAWLQHVAAKQKLCPFARETTSKQTGACVGRFSRHMFHAVAGRIQCARQITAYSAAHHAATSAIMDWTARKYARWEHTKESDAGATRTCGRQKWDAENLWPCGRALGQAPLTQTQPSVCHVT